MNYGLYLSASGVMTNLYRQDVAANNLANVSTVGFRRDLALVRQRDAEAVEDGMSLDVHHDLLDRLGGGVFAGPQRISTEGGPLQKTSNPLDVALDAPNAFFVVRSADAKAGDAVRLTRDGRFLPNADGLLVMASGGGLVLDDDDQPIRLDPGQPASIDQRGQVVQNDQVIAQLQVVAAADPAQLVKEGRNLLRFNGGDGRTPADRAGIRPGFLESSAVDPFMELRALVEATKAVEANANLIKYHDLLMDRAVNQLGRTVA